MNHAGHAHPSSGLPHWATAVACHDTDGGPDAHIVRDSPSRRADGTSLSDEVQALVAAAVVAGTAVAA
jgi:hypothetical protein